MLASELAQTLLRMVEQWGDGQVLLDQRKMLNPLGLPVTCAVVRGVAMTSQQGQYVIIVEVDGAPDGR